MALDPHKETLGFQTEVKQLLDIVVHSLYSNKDVFLRELISNASDAIEKLRFEALSNDTLYEGEPDLKIRVAYDKKARTVTVSDNGIGMSRAEVIDNIGTIARSGTQEFLKALTGDRAKDTQLIGQFGVGFYSAFIVAERVTLTTRRAGTGVAHGVRWESSGAGNYTLETIDRPARGTEVSLHLRADAEEYLDGERLRAIIRRFSDHINLPIVMKAEDKTEGEEETVNRASALWARPRKDVKPEEYEEFYKHVAHDFEAPLAYVHNHVEGKQQYISLLYIPGHAPLDIWDRKERRGIKLYIRRVFVMDDAEQLTPPYLRFVRGVIDSNDLPLNISREILQQSKEIDTIRNASVKRVLGLLEEIAKSDPAKYARFWKEFGRIFKEGVVEDPGNREQIARLLRFSSTRSEGDAQDVSLPDYVARMKDGQQKIFYLTADSLAAARSSPHLEWLRKQDIEVLLLHDRIDEWLVMHLPEFDGKALQSVARGELDLGGLESADDKAEHERSAREHKELLDRMAKALGDKIKEARVSHRLTDSPVCLVADAQDLSANLERILKAVGQEVAGGKPILEVNPDHPLLAHVAAEGDDERFGNWAQLLFEQALLAEGAPLEDPAAFVRRLNELLLTAVKA